MELTIRPGHRGDEAAVAHVHVAAWRAAYVGIMPATYLAGLREDDRARTYRFGTAGAPMTLIAEGTGADACSGIVGFAALGTSSDGVAQGELYALNVHPDYWGRGVGSRLLAAAVEALRAAGVTRATLWVVAANQRARRFYEQRGWRPDGTGRTESLGRFAGPSTSATVAEVRYAIDL